MKVRDLDVFLKKVCERHNIDHDTDIIEGLHITNYGLFDSFATKQVYEFLLDYLAPKTSSGIMASTEYIEPLERFLETLKPLLEAEILAPYYEAIEIKKSKIEKRNEKREQKIQNARTIEEVLDVAMDHMRDVDFEARSDFHFKMQHAFDNGEINKNLDVNQVFYYKGNETNFLSIIAEEVEYVEILRPFLNFPNVKTDFNINGKTLLSIAIKNGNPNIVNLLFEKNHIATQEDVNLAKKLACPNSYLIQFKNYCTYYLSPEKNVWQVAERVNNNFNNSRNGLNQV